jgi:hypothetical protein
MRGIAASLELAALPSAALAGPCLEWRAPERIGALDTAMLPEASGIAASRLFPGRLYLNNDSGDGPYFYVADARGGATTRVAVEGFAPRDVEAIAIGPCAAATTCIWLGDIGDNARVRDTVAFVAAAEVDAFAAQVAPVRTITARYPDGPHDAEAFAFHPNGDLYLVTKTYRSADRSSEPAGIYRLPAAALALAAGTVPTFEHLGTLDLPSAIADAFMNQVATAMDISGDGKRVAILTYRNLFEWNEDLSDGIDPAGALRPGVDYSLTPIAPLLQAEAVAYLPDEDGVVYTSELARLATTAPLIRQICARRE